MNLWSRIKHLWKLSEYEPRVLGSEPVSNGTEIAQIIKKPEQQEARFLPRIKITPAQKIISETEIT